VQPKGVPSSSFRAYFLPIDAPLSSTLLATPRALSRRAKRVRYRAKITSVQFDSQMSKMRFLNSGSWLIVTMRHLIGATMGGNERTCIYQTPTRLWHSRFWPCPALEPSTSVQAASRGFDRYRTMAR
jgi:hypothetical protein